MAWLLDTNVLSELRKPGPDPKVVEFVAAAPLTDLYISVVSLAEIRFGLLKWRLLLEDGRKTGHTFSQPDLFIAATAAHHGLIVVSRDRTHYERAGVPVMSPWA